MKNLRKKREIEIVEIRNSWKEIGFHRPLAGILMNLVFIILTASFGILYTSWFMPYFIFPFPVGVGYTVMVANLFGFGFTMLDLGVGLSLQRFVSEYNIKDPKKSIKYIQFYIYFQMFTGLLQVTGISIWVLFFLSSSDLIYASWLLLLYSTRQFPGMLSVFSGAIKAYQRFDKSNILYFIHAVLLESSTKLICILLGRFVGKQNPAIGELMGATIGAIIGAYIDDFLAAIIGAYWLKPVLQEIDPSYRILTLFRVDFDWSIVKDSLLYGLRPLVAMLIWPAGNLIATAILINYMPNYAVFIGIYSIADFVGSFVGAFYFEIAPPLSEAYNNGKIHLSGDYITRIYKWNGLVGSFLGCVLFTAAPLFAVFAGERFALLGPMLRYLVVFNYFNLFSQLHDAMFNGVGHPEFNIILVFVDQGIRILVLYIMIILFDTGWLALVWSFGLGRIIKWITGYLIFNKRFFKITINVWQTFIVPIIALTFELTISLSLVKWVYPLLNNVMNTLFAAGIIIAVGCVIIPYFIHFILYALLGGWDETELLHFKRAVDMSKPSKWIARPIYKLAQKFSEKTKLFNRFPIKTTKVNEEIAELMQTRAMSIRKDD